jgi:pyruvate dehydrogenase E2 component (dihydrolipoyllysine-residue acetyltransferase)
MIDIVMPFLSGTMEEGTIRRWLKQPGDAVAFGDDLVEVEADKATVVYQADDSGIMAEILVVEGAVVPPGHVIARLLAPGESSQHSAPVPGPELSEPSSAPPPEVDARGQSTEIALTSAERAMVRQVTAAKATVPHFYMSVDVDLTTAIDGLEQRRAEGDGGRTPTISDLVIRACARGLRTHPRLNSSFADGHIRTFARVNVAFAAAVGDAVSTPVVFDADTQSLQTIAITTGHLIRAVREGTVTARELDGATFTISNLGKDGPDSFAAVINPPQAAILAIGRVRSTLSSSGTGKVATLTLSCDHRVLSGVHAAAFLATVRNALEGRSLL